MPVRFGFDFLFQRNWDDSLLISNGDDEIQTRKYYGVLVPMELLTWWFYLFDTKEDIMNEYLSASSQEGGVDEDSVLLVFCTRALHRILSPMLMLIAEHSLEMSREYFLLMTSFLPKGGWDNSGCPEGYPKPYGLTVSKK